MKRHTGCSQGFSHASQPRIALHLFPENILQTERKISVVRWCTLIKAIWFEHQDVSTWNEKGIGLHSPDYITLRLVKNWQVWEYWPELHLARVQTLHCPSKREQCLTHSQEGPSFQDAPFPTSPEGLQSVCKLSSRIFNPEQRILIRMT